MCGAPVQCSLPCSSAVSSSRGAEQAHTHPRRRHAMGRADSAQPGVQRVPHGRAVQVRPVAAAQLGHALCVAKPAASSAPLTPLCSPPAQDDVPRPAAADQHPGHQGASVVHTVRRICCGATAHADRIEGQIRCWRTASAATPSRWPSGCCRASSCLATSTLTCIRTGSARRCPRREGWWYRACGVP